MKSNFILGMPKLFGLGQKHLFTTEFHLLNHACPKSFGTSKIKLDFKNINWELRSFGHLEGKIGSFSCSYHQIRDWEFAKPCGEQTSHLTRFITYRGNSSRNDQVKYNHLSNKKGSLCSMGFQMSTDSYSLFHLSLVLQLRVLEY